MQTYGSSVVPMIEANYEMFTVVEKTIADFFISNEKEMDFFIGTHGKDATCFRSISVTLCQENGLQRIPGVYLQLPALDRGATECGGTDHPRPVFV